MNWRRLPRFGRPRRPAAPTVVDVNELPVDDQGVSILNLARISEVGVANLAAVGEHRIERCFSSVLHHVRLINGGVIRFAYALDGHLLELSAERGTAGRLHLIRTMWP